MHPTWQVLLFKHMRKPNVDVVAPTIDLSSKSLSALQPAGGGASNSPLFVSEDGKHFCADSP